MGSGKHKKSQKKRKNNNKRVAVQNTKKELHKKEISNIEITAQETVKENEEYNKTEEAVRPENSFKQRVTELKRNIGVKLRNIKQKVKNIIKKIPFLSFKIFIIGPSWLYVKARQHLQKYISMLLIGIIVIAFCIMCVDLNEDFRAFVKKIMQISFMGKTPYNLLVDNRELIVKYMTYGMWGCIAAAVLRVLAYGLYLFKWKLLRNKIFKNGCMKYVCRSNDFRERIYKFLATKDTEKCLIVIGDWGIGKSYQIKKFFDIYNIINPVDYYSVSCFAIEKREQLDTLLKEEIKEKDASWEKALAEVLANVPVIGKLASAIIDKVYSIQKLRKNDVIVFEDVERVCSVKYKEQQEKGIRVVAGYANELMERHHKKVILVCNEKELDTEVATEVLYSKLGCEKVEAPMWTLHVINKKIDAKKKELSSERLKIYESLFDRDTDIDKTMQQLLTIAGIKNIRTFEKFLAKTVVFIDNMYLDRVLKQENDKKVLRDDARNQALDYIYSFLFYEIATEFGLSVTDCTKKVPFMNLISLISELKKDYTKSEDTIDKIEKMQALAYRTKNLLINFPTERYWVGYGSIHDFTLNTVAEDAIDLKKFPIEEHDSIRIVRRIDYADNNQNEKTPTQMIVDEIYDMTINSVLKNSGYKYGYRIKKMCEKYVSELSEDEQRIPILECVRRQLELLDGAEQQNLIDAIADIISMAESQREYAVLKGNIKSVVDMTGNEELKNRIDSLEILDEWPELRNDESTKQRVLAGDITRDNIYDDGDDDEYDDDYIAG